MLSERTLKAASRDSGQTLADDYADMCLILTHNHVFF